MPINQTIIKEVKADQQLLEEGFVIIPFLNQKEVEDLKIFFYQNHPQKLEGLYASAHHPDLVYRNQMNDKIKTVFERANQKYFINQSALGGTFMVKAPGEAGSLQPHQDWSIVDEDEWRSFNVWVPLVDVNEKNGSIQVKVKSHLGEKTYRSINIPPSWDTSEKAWEGLKTLNLKAGEALVYDHRLIHASKENRTNEDRLVVVYGIIPKEAEMRYYYFNNNNIDEYACTPDFFLKGNPAGGPNGLSKVREIPYKLNKKDSKSLFKKLKKWLIK